MKTRQQEPSGRGGKHKDGDRQSTKHQTLPSKGKDSARRQDETGPHHGARRPPSSDVRGQPRVPPPPAASRRERGPNTSPTLARQGRELLYGRNAVLEALRGGRGIDRLYLAEGLREDERIRGLISLAAARGGVVDSVPRLLLDDATRGSYHQGVALEAEAYRYCPFEDLVGIPGTVLVLDHLQDPQNFGTLLRAAEAAGVAGIIIPQNRAVEVTPSVVNASAGAVEHLRVAMVPNLARALEALKRSGRWAVGLDAGPGSQDLFAADVPTPLALVVGAEGSGIGPHLRKTCDLLLALPMVGRVESLNAATAGAIALYDVLRRERTALPAQGRNGERLG